MRYFRPGYPPLKPPTIRGLPQSAKTSVVRQQMKEGLQRRRRRRRLFAEECAKMRPPQRNWRRMEKERLTQRHRTKDLAGEEGGRERELHSIVPVLCARYFLVLMSHNRGGVRPARKLTTDHYQRESRTNWPRHSKVAPADEEQKSLSGGINRAVQKRNNYGRRPPASLGTGVISCISSGGEKKATRTFES